jgi:hypothetical protein
MWPSSTISAPAGTCSICEPASPTEVSTTSVRLPRSRPANWYSDNAVGHRRHRAQHGGRIGAQRHHDRKGPARVGAREVAEVEGPAAVGQPAHDHLPRPITCWR